MVHQPGLESSFDLALYSVFTDAAALRAYAVHPDIRRWWRSSGPGAPDAPASTSPTRSGTRH
ncbi:MAG: hypothetical protein R2719_07725 [Micropruina sp.]